MNERRCIKVLTTGGTFEKTYLEREGELKNQGSRIQRYILPKLRLPCVDVPVIEVLAIDSLLMDDSHRKLVSEAIAKESADGWPLLVVHGTDTMDQTMVYCEREHLQFSVPVVFTGAMKPVGFEDSDAIQNFTEALYATQILQPGLYLSFHGNLFEGSAIRKNRELGTFEKVQRQ